MIDIRFSSFLFLFLRKGKKKKKVFKGFKMSNSAAKKDFDSKELYINNMIDVYRHGRTNTSHTKATTKESDRMKERNLSWPKKKLDAKRTNKKGNN